MKNCKLNRAIGFALYGSMAGAVLIPVAAFAQKPAAEDTSRLEATIVTGSRIKRTEIETSQPVFALEREDLERTGLTSIVDILTDLTSNGATIGLAVNNGNGNGVSHVDLRNCGSNRTLVLVNGRRWVSELGGSVDLSTIPFAAVERIEVLKDGASSIYGTDAICGVINITMRDTFDGTQVSAYVASLSGGEVGNSELIAPGKQIFADNCVACHGDNGKGNVELGAPDLTDAISLYGSGEAAIASQVRAPRHGVMPAWAARLGDATVKELAVYIHSLGGGE